MNLTLAPTRKKLEDLLDDLGESLVYMMDESDDVPLRDVANDGDLCVHHLREAYRLLEFLHSMSEGVFLREFIAQTNGYWCARYTAEDWEGGGG